MYLVLYTICKKGRKLVSNIRLQSLNITDALIVQEPIFKRGLLKVLVYPPPQT